MITQPMLNQDTCRSFHPAYLCSHDNSDLFSGTGTVARPSLYRVENKPEPLKPSSAKPTSRQTGPELPTSPTLPEFRAAMEQDSRWKKEAAPALHFRAGFICGGLLSMIALGMALAF